MLPQYLYYTVQQTTNNALVVEDPTNHTLNITIDGGTPEVPTNSPTSLGYGAYRLELDAAERVGDSIALCGDSVTVDAVIYPVNVQVDANVDVKSIAGVTFDAQMATGLAFYCNVGTPGKTMNDVGIASASFVSQAIKLDNGVRGLYRGDTWLNYEILGVDVTGYTSIKFSLKNCLGDSNEDALIYIEEPGGLITINGEDPSSALNGAIVVTDLVSGSISIRVEASETLKLPAKSGNLYADIEVTSGANVSTPLRFPMCIIADVTTT